MYMTFLKELKNIYKFYTRRFEIENIMLLKSTYSHYE